MARTHNRVSSRIWTGRTARELRAYPLIVRVLQHWLTENESAVVEPYGVYHLQLDLAVLQIGAVDERRPGVGVSRAELEKALGILEQLDFCVYDEDSEWIWIREMAAHQVLEAYQPLKEKDWRIRAAQKFYDGLPAIPQLGPFFDHYVDLLHLTNRRNGQARKRARPLEGASEGASEAPKSTDRLPDHDQGDLLEEDREALVLRAPQGSQALQAEAALANFDEWWRLYPQKTGKLKAREAWLKHKPPFAQIMDTTRAYLDSVQWAPKRAGDESSRAIPYPATFINGHMWEDTPTPLGSRGGLGTKNAAMVQRTAGFAD